MQRGSVVEVLAAGLNPVIVSVQSEQFELERVAEAWERLVASAHRKIVLVP